MFINRITKIRCDAEKTLTTTYSMTFGSHISKIEAMHGGEVSARVSGRREEERKKSREKQVEISEKNLFRFQQIPTWLLMLGIRTSDINLFSATESECVCLCECGVFFLFSFLTPSSFIFFSVVFVSVYDIEHTHTHTQLDSHVTYTYIRRKPKRSRILLMLRFYRIFFPCSYF